jgi:hypothetical protein
VRRLALIALGSMFISAPAFAELPYDGRWNVTIVTKAGSCDPSARSSLTIADGRVSGPPGVSGNVGHGGAVRVSMGGGHASGQLNGNAGSGTWAGGACSGRWQASKK